MDIDYNVLVYSRQVEANDKSVISLDIVSMTEFGELSFTIRLTTPILRYLCTNLSKNIIKM